MGRFAEYAEYDGLGLAELVCKREVHPRELVEAAIERIEAGNPRLNAIVRPLLDAGRAQAETPLSGAFAGVPFLVKDIGLSLAGVPTSQGTRLLKDVPSLHDDELLLRYRAAGLVILGKTNTPEFGLASVTEPEAWGPAHNPYDLARTPGGSSGGSGAAVAARLTPIAHASDGGGSIRIPASCCGLVGLKPTRGRTPSGPIVGEIWRGFAVSHALTRTVRDSAALLDATQGPDVGAPYKIAPPERPYLEEVGVSPGRLRIAVATEPFLGDAVDAECVRAVETTAGLLSDLGHVVEEAAPPIERERWAMAFLTILAAETGAEMDDIGRRIERAARSADFELLTSILGMFGHSWSAADYAAAARYLQTWSRSVGVFFERYDALLTPVLPTLPPLIGAQRPSAAEAATLRILRGARAARLMLTTGLAKTLGAKALANLPYTPLFNVTGQPAVSLPLHWTQDGPPVGVQFAARWGDEATLFRLAGQLEQARPWSARRPDGF
jgi:amidase